MSFLVKLLASVKNFFNRVDESLFDSEDIKTDALKMQYPKRFLVLSLYNGIFPDFHQNVRVMSFFVKGIVAQLKMSIKYQPRSPKIYQENTFPCVCSLFSLYPLLLFELQAWIALDFAALG